MIGKIFSLAAAAAVVSLSAATTASADAATPPGAPAAPVVLNYWCSCTAFSATNPVEAGYSVVLLRHTYTADHEYTDEVQLYSNYGQCWDDLKSGSKTSVCGPS